jgi:hypothetical protein
MELVHQPILVNDGMCKMATYRNVLLDPIAINLLSASPGGG